MSSLVVKKIGINFIDFTDPNIIDNFYKALGDNLPQYTPYCGGCCYIIFCVKEDFDTKAIYEKFRLVKNIYEKCKGKTGFYDEQTFITDMEKFNNNHKIVPSYYPTGEPYKLEKVY